ncbi:MAG TPA: ABC transporter ATP-binding protein, partial [Thermoanaerobaculia bacterium]
MDPAIEVSGLRKVYGRRITALDGIDFTVRPGELFGLLGPNGAGKTTAVKILLGLTPATAGRALVSGLPVSNPESRRRVGYLPEGHRIPGYLTARQALSIFGRMSEMDSVAIKRRTAELLEKVRLSGWADVRVRKFSKGMTQRLGLAAALIHAPNVLLLDEPTDGVDPVGRREIRDLLRDEAKNGTAVLLNSHLLSEIELTCDRVA